MPLVTYMLSIVNTHLEVGASVLVTGKSITTRGFWDDYDEHRITSFSGAYVYQILKRLSLEKIFTPSQVNHSAEEVKFEIALELVKLCEQKGLKCLQCTDRLKLLQE